MFFVQLILADSSLMFFLLVQVPFSKVVYIEQSDFRLKDSKDYYGLAPGKSVLLRCVKFCSYNTNGST